MFAEYYISVVNPTASTFNLPYKRGNDLSENRAFLFETPSDWRQPGGLDFSCFLIPLGVSHKKSPTLQIKGFPGGFPCRGQCALQNPPLYSRDLK